MRAWAEGKEGWGSLWVSMGGSNNVLIVEYPVL